MLALLFRRRRGIEWYEFFLLLIAFVIVYPDVVAEKVAGVLGKGVRGSQIIAVEVLGLAGMTAFTLWLLPRYPKFEWWAPIAWVAGVLGFRMIHHLLVSLSISGG